jgi:uncharacterized damage-inducible protein DinB
MTNFGKSDTPLIAAGEPMGDPTVRLDSELVALRRFFRYIENARTIYLEAFSRLPPDALQEDRGASFPTILDIFAHALRAYQGWIVYAYKDTTEPEDERVVWTLPQVTELSAEVARIVDQFLQSLTPADLDREFTFHWTPGDESTRTSLKTRDMLWHLVEEELQHRGEINALLWQRDLPVPVLGWETWAPAQAQHG